MLAPRYTNTRHVSQAYSDIVRSAITIRMCTHAIHAPWAQPFLTCLIFSRLDRLPYTGLWGWAVHALVCVLAGIGSRGQRRTQSPRTSLGSVFWTLATKRCARMMSTVRTACRISQQGLGCLNRPIVTRAHVPRQVATACRLAAPRPATGGAACSTHTREDLDLFRRVNSSKI